MTRGPRGATHLLTVSDGLVTRVTPPTPATSRWTGTKPYTDV